jgi:flagellum-specific peptidoglycan hydrolase FlgJ
MLNKKFRIKSLYIFAIIFLFVNVVYGQKTWKQMSTQEKTSTSKRVADETYSEIEILIPLDRRAFIKRFGWLAIYDYNEYGVLASVKLAQGGLECGFGNILDRGLKVNNYFSIKCRGNNHKSHKCLLLNDAGEISHFMHYNNAFDSFRGHTNHIQKYYSSLINQQNYKRWTSVLSKKYAVDKEYERKLNFLIKKYELTKYDVKI